MKDYSKRIVAKLQRHRPRTDAKGTFDVCRLDDAILSEVKYVVTTGLKPFDDLVGPVPFGRITEMYGTEASGKSALAVHLALRAQLGYVYRVKYAEDRINYELEQLDPDSYVMHTLFVDNENSFFAARMHMQGEFLRGSGASTDTVDQLFELMDVTMDEIKKIGEETKLEQLLFAAVDTIAGTASKEEMAQDWAKDDYARQARQLREGFRILKNKIRRQNASVFCTNQVSEKFDKSPQPFKPQGLILPRNEDLTSFGGKALKFWSSQRVFSFEIPLAYKLLKSSAFPDASLIGFISTKNRFKKPMRQGRLVLLYDEKQGGFHESLSILETLLYLKFAEVTDTGEITFKFQVNNLTTTTFPNNKDPKITSRAEWLTVYPEHKADFDLLWDAAVKKSFRSEGLDGVLCPDDADTDSEPAEPTAADSVFGKSP